MGSLTVVGVASSPTSRAALRWALRHAALAGGAVELLHVVPAGSGPGSTNAAGHLLAQTMRAASALAPSVAVTTRTVRGDVVAAMVSASVAATMLVVGASRARSRTAGRRSISRGVAAAAVCPVVLVPNTDRRYSFGVVLGADDSTSGRAALRFAETEAAATGQHLTMVRAWSGRGAPTEDAVEPAFDDTARRAAVRLLDHLSSVVWRGHPEVEVDLQSAGGPVSDVLVHSSMGAHLLVVGDGRDAADGTPRLGPVARAALDRMISPIAVVHPTEESARSEDARWDDAVSEGWIDLASAHDAARIRRSQRDVLPWSRTLIGARVAG